MSTHELFDRAADEIEDPGQGLDVERKQLIDELRAEAEGYRRAEEVRKRSAAMTEQEKQDEMHPKEKNVAKRSRDQLVVDYVETKAEGERRLAFISRHGLLGAYFAEGSP